RTDGYHKGTAADTLPGVAPVGTNANTRLTNHPDLPLPYWQEEVCPKETKCEQNAAVLRNLIFKIGPKKHKNLPYFKERLFCLITKNQQNVC
ncbi:MAG TPA: hypothetical protein VGA80_05110, partial [Flavobacteriaceae bacterium]